MNYKNRIRSLYRTDDATAGVIMQHYPPQWDMDRVFQKAYQGYLAQKQEPLQTAVPFSSEVTETVEYTAENRISRSIRKAGGYAGLAAAMVGAFLLIFKGFSLRSPVDQIPDETIPPMTTQTTPETTTGTTEETVYETTAVSGFIPVFTDVSAPETTASATEITHTETSTETARIATETVTSVTESIQTQAGESVTPDSMETSVTTIETSTESTQETTTTTETTTAPPVIPLGHFEVSEQSGSFGQITYVRDNALPVEEHEHSFAAEGFALTNVQVQNPDYDFRSVIYNLEDDAGQHYMVQQHRYDYFQYAYNTSVAWQTRSYTIGGRMVFLVYQDDPESVCNLMWDDGCHVCVMTSQYKDLANMELLMQGMINE